MKVLIVMSPIPSIAHLSIANSQNCLREMQFSPTTEQTLFGITPSQNEKETYL